MKYPEITTKKLISTFRKSLAAVQADPSIVAKSSFAGFVLQSRTKGSRSGWCVLLDFRSFSEVKDAESIQEQLALSKKNFGKQKRKLKFQKHDTVQTTGFRLTRSRPRSRVAQRKGAGRA